MVGILFFVALGILGYYTVIMSHEVLKPENSYTLTVQFNDAGGLVENSRAFVNGVNSGKVVSIQLHDEYVEVVLLMFNRFTLYENYDIRIKSEAALGGKQININPGKKTDAKGRVFAVVSTGGLLVGSLDDPIATITSLVEENRENIYVSIRNIRDFTGKMNSGQGTVARLLNDGKLANQANDLLEQVRETVEDAREQAPVTSFIRAALTVF